MKRPRLAAPGLSVASAALLWIGVVSGPAGPAPRELIVVPHALRGARALVPTVAQLTIYNPGEAGGAITIDEVVVRSRGVVLARVPLGRQLVGEAEYGALQALIERLPHEVTHRHDAERYYAPADAPPIPPHEVQDKAEEVRRRVALLGRKYDAGVPQPFIQPLVPLPVDQLFFADDPAGTTAPVAFEVRYTLPGGASRTHTVAHELTRLADFGGVPASYTELHGGRASVVAGDLHVHSCHGEAVGACAPSDNCVAESFQTSGAFSYAQLKGQFQALGLAWFTATDHSYCIDFDSEYAAVVSETVALTDASFVVIPDLELSSEEEGPQTGGDTGDFVCLLGPQANHMGAHGISQRIAGGSQGFLGFCDGLFSDALEPFSDNIAAVRAQGGFPIANHPAAGAFGWNSVASAVGQEADGLHGVEIWNGALQTGQGGNVGAWVGWLLGGRRLYAYSGSDTHDEAFDFGANHALIEGPLAPDSVLEALRAGRSYVSNGPALILEVELGHAFLPMGSVHVLPEPVPPVSAAVHVHYDFGAASGVIDVFTGAVGAAHETLLCSSAQLSGAGVFSCDLPLASAADSWVRAYAQGTGGAALAAYTNPVFFELGSGSPLNYCTAKPDASGCAPRIAASGTPSVSAGSGFVLSGLDLRNQSFGLLAYAYAADFLPFFGGTLCIGQPLVRGAAMPTGGNPGAPDCSGGLAFDFNTWIAGGVDQNLVIGATVYAQYWYRNPQAAIPVGLTDAVQFTLLP
jgi:hypothetical protein